MAHRIHMSDSETVSLHSRPAHQAVGMKPLGLWYGIGDSWIRWCAENDYGTGKNAFRINLDDSALLVVGRDMSMDEFDRKYCGRGLPGGLLSHFSIDWPAAAKRYAGIEIPHYSWRHRLEFSWYYGWDVASGCVWDAGCIESVERVDSMEAV